LVGRFSELGGCPGNPSKSRVFTWVMHIACTHVMSSGCRKARFRAATHSMEFIKKSNWKHSWSDCSQNSGGSKSVCCVHVWNWWNSFKWERFTTASIGLEPAQLGRRGWVRVGNWGHPIASLLPLAAFSPPGTTCTGRFFSTLWNRVLIFRSYDKPQEVQTSTRRFLQFSHPVLDFWWTRRCLNGSITKAFGISKRTCSEFGLRRERRCW
jgi:hypothetical protein